MPEFSRSRASYGDHPSLHAEAWRPAGAAPHPAAVVLHGGWWRARHGRDVMDGLCADLARRGWFVWNVEYRRIDGDGGGWPATYHDVLAAIDRLAAVPGLRPPTVAVGHSAGGHLALLAASARPLSAVVALAPVTDLHDSVRAGLGEGAVESFVGSALAADPDRLLRASPLGHLPLGCPQLVVHGDQDQRVPVQHSRNYLAAARAAGDDVTYVELPQADHFAVIDPTTAGWRQVVTWIDRLPPGLGRAGGPAAPHDDAQER